MLSAGSRIGHWTIEKPLGEGAMGSIFRARHDDGRVGALKVLKTVASDDARARFLREIDALAQLDHPSVVGLLDKGFDERHGWPFLAMELLEGRDLAAVMTEAPLDPTTAVALVQPLAFALAHAHEVGLAHRDIKPANLFQCSDGSVRVVDFGVALDEARTRLTRGNLVPGTMAYIAPEVIRGDTVHPRQGDQYALGLVLYELLTGKSAFPADPGLPHRAQLAAVVNAKVDTPAFDIGKRFPASLRRAVRVATAPACSDRFPSMMAFAEALEGDFDTHPPPQRRSRAFPLLIGALVACVPLVIAPALAIALLVLVPAAMRRMEPSHPQLVASGEAVYDQRCAVCHSSDIASSLSDGNWETDPTALRKTIGEGRAEGCPKWSATLTDAEIDAVTAFVQSKN